MLKPGVSNVSELDGDLEFMDLGVDSLMSVEIKQVLERELDLVLRTEDIQLMTFNALMTMLGASEKLNGVFSKLGLLVV